VAGAIVREHGTRSTCRILLRWVDRSRSPLLLNTSRQARPDGGCARIS
jgi:hypothetical protein